MNFPQDDPGPGILLTGVSSEKNHERLKFAWSKYKTAFGLMNYKGSRFVSVRDDLVPIVSWAKHYNLLFVDSGEVARSQIDEVSSVLKSDSLVVDEIFKLNRNASDLDRFLRKIIESSVKDGLKVVRIEVSPKIHKALLEFLKSDLAKSTKFYSLSEAFTHRHGVRHTQGKGKNNAEKSQHNIVLWNQYLKPIQ